MTAPAPRAAALAPLRNPTFRAFWLASLVSNFGGLIQAVAAAWLMTTLAGSPDMVALVQASTTLPIMLFSLPAGAVADGFDRRRVMIAALSFLLAVSAALAVAAWAGWLTPWRLLGFTFLMGCGTALFNPSWQASVGDIVDRATVPAAVALNSVGFNLTRSVGPALGGALVAAAGVSAAFAVNAASYLGMIGALWFWKPPARATGLPRESMGRAMLAGVTYAAMSPNVARVYLRSFAFGLASIATLALLPVVARDQVGGGPLTYGALLGAFGIGAVGGAFLGARLRAALSGEAVARIGFCGVALAAATAAASGSAWLTGAGLLAGGASWVMALSLFNTTVQLSAPRWVLGRALALYQTATFGGMAMGAWLWGRAAAGWGLEAALYGAAGAALLGAAIGLRLPLPRPPELSLDPLDRFRPPALAVDLTPRSGPVAVLIEYRIAEADLGEFHRVMAERQRIRRRDGARGWTFLRDVEDPELWYESYQTATWTDYLRLQSRPTQADAAVGERLRALHRGPERPRVHRMLVRQPGGGHDAPAAAAPPPDLP